MSRLIDILRMSKEELIEKLKNKPEALVNEHSIIWLRDRNLPTLVAHIDTVYDKSNERWHDRIILHQCGFYWSPDGIGGDDRCGVYAVMKLYNELPVNAIFTDGEESGGIGAEEIVEINKEDLKDVPYFIEIDRRGFKECVYYSNEVEIPEFVGVVESLFNRNTGTFSDVSIIGAELGIASVNLSAGFYCEHQKSGEYIIESHLEYTIKHIPNLIELLGNKQFKVKPKYSHWYDWGYVSRNYWAFNAYDNDDMELYYILQEMLYSHEPDYSDYLWIDITEKDLERVKYLFTRKEIKKLRKIIHKLNKMKRELIQYE